jgi:hypothetical protein
MAKSPKRKLTAKDKKEIASWINEDSCLCMDELTEFQKCCGKDMELFSQLLKWTQQPSRVRPRFKSLSLEQKNKIIDRCSELGVKL